MKINLRESSPLSLFAGKKAPGVLGDSNHTESDIPTSRGTSDETKTYVKGSYKDFANSFRSAQGGPTNKLR